jgi:2-polyprenyl-3-methyl-5-hydroxy-6-metoxy-1,4-benzoquinol methylase/uncharacterized protein YbaR (Trm112 family)
MTTVVQPVIGSRNTYTCPVCMGSLNLLSQAYFCNHCDRTYPILFGIPDFRLRSDRYLSIEDERAKAERIALKSGSGFCSMLDYYYQITDDVPAELATRYKAYHHNSITQAEHSLKCLTITSEDHFLDVGCGTGGALIATTEKTEHIIGVDIALRWLIICKQRLKEHGVNATLVCADVESLPFHDQSFTKILANDLLENVYSVDKTLTSLNRQLQPNGSLWISGSNKFCIGPHPSTRLWAIGFFPGRIRSIIVKRLRGVDSLRFINLISPLKIVRRAKKLGLQVSNLSPKIVQIEVNDQYPLIDQLLIRIYITITRMRLFRYILVLIGPAFEMILNKPPGKNQKTETK